MARSFAGGAATDKIEFSNYSAIQGVRPVTVSLWIYVAAYDTTYRRVWDKNADTAGAGHSALLCADVTGAGQNELVFVGALWDTTAGNWTIAGPTAGTWAHYCVTYAYSATTDDPVVYLNGSSVTVTESVTPSGIIGSESANLVLGNRAAPSDTRAHNGRMAEFAVWNRALAASEVAVLADGFSAQFVPNGLVFYSPLIGRYSPEVNKYGSSGTVTGATAIEHPRIIYPAPRRIMEYTPAAAASTVHRLMLMGCGI